MDMFSSLMQGLAAASSLQNLAACFFGVLIGMVAINLAHTFAVGQRGLDLDLLFQCLLVSGSVTGLMLRRTRADTLLASAMIVMVVVYIGLGYSTVEVGSP